MAKLKLKRRKQETKTISYLRVSTAQQDLKKDKNSVLHLANERDLGKVEFIEEKVSRSLIVSNKKH